jgi:hypothetical protein
MILKRLLCALILVCVNVWAQEVKLPDAGRMTPAFAPYKLEPEIFEPLDQITLDQITKDNFKNLQIVGFYSTRLGGSTEEGHFE